MQHMTGTVAMWNDDKGYGFIKPDSGDVDVFCHASNCVDELKKGDRVKFDERPSRRGKPEAFAVEII
jgi:cold shock protein